MMRLMEFDEFLEFYADEYTLISQFEYDGVLYAVVYL